ncbi:MAG: hypothetical protein JSW39_09085, partial [Desulfobacterales bacterium]
MKSYLMARDFLRYILPSKAPEDKPLVFFPYWRFKGMLFAADSSGIKHKFIDVSHQAVESHVVPVSVGLRSQALRLQFARADIQGRFLKPTQPLEQVIKTQAQRFTRSLSQPILHQSHIGETISLLYAPYYVADRLYDAVIDEPVKRALPDDFDVEQLPADSSGWHINFIATVCPDCGWDLDGERNALVLICQNCRSAWYPVRNNLKKLKFAWMTSAAQADLYLPFWRISAEIEGIQLHSYADLIRIANLPKVIQSGWDELPFWFWAPAFKVRPQVFLRLSSNLVLIQPDRPLNPELPDARLFPVTLAVEEAAESLHINLASFLKPNNTL